jgi:low affinity Fe/Cu permease
VIFGEFAITLPPCFISMIFGELANFAALFYFSDFLGSLLTFLSCFISVIIWEFANFATLFISVLFGKFTNFPVLFYFSDLWEVC